MKILIPTPLRQFADGKTEVKAQATTVQGGLVQLVEMHPQLKANLFTPEGKLRSFVNVYLNDDDVRDLPEGLNAVATDADEISIIPSIAGGSCA